MAEDRAPRSFSLGSARDTGTGNTPGNTVPGENRGRRSATPKPRTLAAKGDVDRAVALLDTMYELLGDGLELFGLEETHEKWASAVTKLRRTNRDSLSASPKLAKSIANFGEGGGATTFFVAHVVAFATLYPTARREMQANLAARPPRHAASDANTGGVDWDAMAAAAAGEVPTTGAFNAGEFIPGL